MKTITDKVKTFEDVCKILEINTTVPDFSILPIPSEHIKSFTAYYKLIMIAKALNEGWEPNWDDDKEKKWYPYFAMKTNNGCGDLSGFGFSCTYYDFWGAYTGCGSRLYFRTQHLAKYAGKQFEAIYKDFLILEDKELRKINLFLE
jgi:hypothetical protein